jgi:hypothetical protein
MMTPDPSPRTIDILTDTRPFSFFDWMGAAFGVVLCIAFVLSGLAGAFKAARPFITGDYDAGVAWDMMGGLLLFFLFVGIGFAVLWAIFWDISRKSWSVRPADRMLVVRVSGLFWQFTLAYPFDAIRDVRVGSSTNEGTTTYFTELVGRFEFSSPISHPDQRKSPGLTVETIRTALRAAGWRPAP